MEQTLTNGKEEGANKEIVLSSSPLSISPMKSSEVQSLQTISLEMPYEK